jgi:hypothetical protein
MVAKAPTLAKRFGQGMAVLVLQIGLYPYEPAESLEPPARMVANED